MKETSPYENIHVGHLEDHDFQPERADFVLVHLPNGGTRLGGTTTYQTKCGPACTGAYGPTPLSTASTIAFSTT